MECDLTPQGELSVRFDSRDTFQDRVRVLAAIPDLTGQLASVRRDENGEVLTALLPEAISLTEATNFLNHAKTVPESKVRQTEALKPDTEYL